MYNRLKYITKKTCYAQIFYYIKHDISQTWKIIKSTIRNLNDKTATPQTFKIDHTKWRKICKIVYLHQSKVK